MAVRERIKELIDRAHRLVASGDLDAARDAIVEAQRLADEHRVGQDLVDSVRDGIGEYLTMARLMGGGAT